MNATRVRTVILPLALLGFLVSAAAAEAAGDGRKLDRALHHVLETGTTAAQSVIIRVQPGQLAALEGRLKAAGDVIVSEHASLNAVTALVNVADLDPLTADGTVLTVSTNARVSGFANPSSGGTTAVNVLRASQGLTSTSPNGKGIGVAIIDSGIQAS